MTKTFLPKPVSMVVANTMHAAAMEQKHDLAAILHAAMAGAKEPPPSQYIDAETAARQMLCQIAHECSMTVVMAALNVAGAPSTIDQIGDALKTLRDEQVRVA